MLLVLATSLLLTEAGLWRVLILTGKPAGVRLRDWLDTEVLPSLRRSGHYSLLPPAPSAPTPLALPVLPPGFTPLSAGLVFELLQAEARLGTELPELRRLMLEEGRRRAPLPRPPRDPLREAIERRLARFNQEVRAWLRAVQDAGLAHPTGNSTARLLAWARQNKHPAQAPLDGLHRRLHELNTQRQIRTCEELEALLVEAEGLFGRAQKALGEVADG